MAAEEPKALPPPNLGGRPTKLTDQMIAELCKSIKGGVYPDTAAAKQGIHASTFRSWLKQGAREAQVGIGQDSIHVRFYEAMREADAEAEERLTLHLSKMAETHFVAALAILERRWPQRWRRPTDDRENKRAVMEAVLKAVIDTIQLVRTARPGLTDDELVAYVFEQIELPFEDTPEPTSPRDATATAPIVVQVPSRDGGNGPQPAGPPGPGPVLEAEPQGLEEQRNKEAEKVLKGGK